MGGANIHPGAGAADGREGLVSPAEAKALVREATDIKAITTEACLAVMKATVRGAGGAGRAARRHTARTARPLLPAFCRQAQLFFAKPLTGAAAGGADGAGGEARRGCWAPRGVLPRRRASSGRVACRPRPAGRHCPPSRVGRHPGRTHGGSAAAAAAAAVGGGGRGSPRDGGSSSAAPTLTVRLTHLSALAPAHTLTCTISFRSALPP